MPNPLLNIKIISRKEDLELGECLSLSSVNSRGKFDILPEHANFITLIKDHPITVRLKDNSSQTFNFPTAIIHTQDNLVKIYTDIQNS